MIGGGIQIGISFAGKYDLFHVSASQTVKEIIELLAEIGRKIPRGTKKEQSGSWKTYPESVARTSRKPGAQTQ